ncbi:MAG: response regulator transcription factor [Candidatus Aminicenantes bacterium]|nr:response regulator transcription factor [Candidatus Aminicenantes bacterium]
MKKILIIEDDDALRATLTTALEVENFVVLSANDGEKGFSLACQEKIDLIALDLVLPLKTGLEVCKELRKKNILTPIIMMTGQKQEELDKVLGLEIGADDYLLKPFGIKEFLARVNAILRRTSPKEIELEEYSFGDVTINFKKQTAKKGDENISFTSKEFGLLKLLITLEGEVVSREKILNVVWGYETYPTTRTIDTFVHNIRKKIEDDPSNSVFILTIPWSGYKFQK